MFAQAFVLGVNHLLGAETWARQRLAPFAGRTARIVMPPWRAVVMVTDDGLLAEAAAEQVDVEFVLPVAAPFVAVKGREALLKEARIAGSVDLAETLGQVLRTLRWDYEEDLSRVLGDIPARRLAGLFRSLAAWPRDAGRNLAETTVEYLTQEQPMLASRAGLGRLGASITELEQALDRLDARVRRVEKGRRSAR